MRTPISAEDTGPTLTQGASTFATGSEGSVIVSEFRILAQFRPSEYTTEVIQSEIRPLLPDCCQRERISVRIPQGIAPHPDNLEWHRDGMPAYHMVVWANEDPTEIRLTSGDVVRGEPLDVVWFNNKVVHHRQPKGTDETRRWFVSVRCSGA